MCRLKKVCTTGIIQKENDVLGARGSGHACCMEKDAFFDGSFTDSYVIEDLKEAVDCN